MRTNILAADMRKPLATLLSQTYAKPVQLNLTPLAQPHLDSSILAAVVTEKMRDRLLTPRQIQKDHVNKVKLPQRHTVLNMADFERIATRGLRRRPSLRTVGMRRTSLSDVLYELRLKRVSSIAVRIAGRYGRRLNADMAQKVEARSGLSGKASGFLVRNVRPIHTTYSSRGGKKKVGAYGVKVWIGHS